MFYLTQFIHNKPFQTIYCIAFCTCTQAIDPTALLYLILQEREVITYKKKANTNFLLKYENQAHPGIVFLICDTSLYASDKAL